MNSNMNSVWGGRGGGNSVWGGGGGGGGGRQRFAKFAGEEKQHTATRPGVSEVQKRAVSRGAGVAGFADAAGAAADSRLSRFKFFLNFLPDFF
jgi:hypothetical protein